MARTRKPGARLVLSGGKAPRLRKPRKTDWTVAKRDVFIATLAATCNIQESCRVARVSDTTVYKKREICAEFRALWLGALRTAYARLELMLLERGMNGTVKTVTRADGSIDRTHEYPNHIALQLLRMHKDTVAAAEEEHDPDEIEAARRRIVRKLAAVRRRIETRTGDGRSGEAA